MIRAGALPDKHGRVPDTRAAETTSRSWRTLVERVGVRHALLVLAYAPVLPAAAPF
jgi:hypothetical protein